MEKGAQPLYPREFLFSLREGNEIPGEIKEYHGVFYHSSWGISLFVRWRAGKREMAHLSMSEGFFFFGKGDLLVQISRGEEGGGMTY